MRSFSSEKSSLSTSSCSKNVVSPGSLICTLRIIWRTIISKCLSLIFTPCKRYTSWTSLTIYSWTAVGPMIDKISAGVMIPSDNGVPARTASCSCTRICFERLTRYLRCSPVLEVIIISRLPRLTLPIVTSPSISETTAGLNCSNVQILRPCQKWVIRTFLMLLCVTYRLRQSCQFFLLF